MGLRMGAFASGKPDPDPRAREQDSTAALGSKQLYPDVSPAAQTGWDPTAGTGLGVASPCWQPGQRWAYRWALGAPFNTHLLGDGWAPGSLGMSCMSQSWQGERAQGDLSISACTEGLWGL